MVSKSKKGTVAEKEVEGEGRDDLITKRTQRRHHEMLTSKSGEWRDGVDPVKMYLSKIGQVTLLNRAVSYTHLRAHET